MTPAPPSAPQPPPESGTPRVVVVGRAGCHLCDDVYAVVDRVCREAGEGWAKTSIDQAPDLAAAYAELIPVVLVDGIQIAQWRLHETELRAALAR